MLITYRTFNSIVRFSKYLIYKKLLSDVTLFSTHIYIYIYIVFIPCMYIFAPYYPHERETVETSKI